MMICQLMNRMKLDEKLGKIIDSYYDDLPVDEQNETRRKAG